MIVIVLAALALPLALVGLGVRKIASRNPVSETSQEVPGLRAALEGASERNLHPPAAIADGRSVFILSQASGGHESDRRAVENRAIELKGVVLPVCRGEGGEERILVQIPSANAGLFESDGLQRFTQTAKGCPTDGKQVYEIIFSQP